MSRYEYLRDKPWPGFVKKELPLAKGGAVVRSTAATLPGAV